MDYFFIWILFLHAFTLLLGGMTCRQSYHRDAADNVARMRRCGVVCIKLRISPLLELGKVWISRLTVPDAK